MKRLKAGERGTQPGGRENRRKGTRRRRENDSRKKIQRKFLE